MDTDKLLVLGLKNDDIKAFDKLFWKFRHKIYINALKITKDRDASEDIAQEVFITLWEKRSSIDSSRPISNWIFVISYYKSIDYLKNTKKTDYMLNIYKEPSWNILEEEEDRNNLEEEQFDLIQRAVNDLSPQKQKVFELCKMQGKTYEKAAYHLGISKHTVKEYLSAAMKYVREFVNTS